MTQTCNGSTADENWAPTYLIYKRITGLTPAALMTQISIDMHTTGTCKIKMGVYTDAPDNPSTLLEQVESGEFTITGYETKSLSLSGSTAVPANGIIWIAVIANIEAPSFRAHAEASGSGEYSVYAADTTPSGRWTNYGGNLYATAIISGDSEMNIRACVTTSPPPFRAWIMGNS